MRARSTPFWGFLDRSQGLWARIGLSGVVPVPEVRRLVVPFMCAAAGALHTCAPTPGRPCTRARGWWLHIYFIHKGITVPCPHARMQGLKTVIRALWWDKLRARPTIVSMLSLVRAGMRRHAPWTHAGVR